MSTNSSVIGLQNATTLQKAGNVDPNADRTELGKDAFLQLLVTQLSAQDPLNPADSTQFVAQLSQFASLEQLTNVSGKMDDLIGISGASNAANAVSLLGKDVRVAGTEVKGNEKVYYELEIPAQKAKLEVRNAAGEVVKTIDNVPTSSGVHEIQLEGLEPGEYTFSIDATDTAGDPIGSFLSHAERVSGVSFNGSVPTLLMESGAQMAANKVVEIREPKGL